VAGSLACGESLSLTSDEANNGLGFLQGEGNAILKTAFVENGHNCMPKKVSNLTIREVLSSKADSCGDAESNKRKPQRDRLESPNQNPNSVSFPPINDRSLHFCPIEQLHVYCCSECGPSFRFCRELPPRGLCPPGWPETPTRLQSWTRSALDVARSNGDRFRIPGR